MANPEALIRPNVISLIPYSSARDEFEGREGIFLDANENPFGTLNRYPDPYQKELKEKLSRIKGIPAGNIFLGNGSDEIIDLTFRIFCTPGTDKALTFTPTYGMYDVSASANDVKMIRVPLNKSFQIDPDSFQPYLSDEKLKLILICSPNNPTGNLFKRETIEKITGSFNGIVLIDEAYIDFAGEKSFKDSIGSYANLIVMQTFSKAFGLASARIGMAFADSSVIKYFNKMKPPYNISTINQKAALKALDRTGLYRNRICKIKNERLRLTTELNKLQLTEKIFPSEANFLLVKVNNAKAIYNYLAERKIIVRNRSNVVENCLRVTVGTRSENDKLLKALKTFTS